MKDISLEQLDDREQQAVRATRETIDRAYAPYSKFRVACSLLFPDGGSIQGVNVENASYGLSMCAERSAVFQAIQHGETRFESLVIVSETEEPATPCGACRQVLSEFCPDLRILLVGRAKIQECSLSELLPHAFRDWREDEES